MIQILGLQHPVVEKALVFDLIVLDDQTNKGLLYYTNGHTFGANSKPALQLIRVHTEEDYLTDRALRGTNDYWFTFSVLS